MFAMKSVQDDKSKSNFPFKLLKLLSTIVFARQSRTHVQTSDVQTSDVQIRVMVIEMLLKRNGDRDVV